MKDPRFWPGGGLGGRTLGGVGFVNQVHKGGGRGILEKKKLVSLEEEKNLGWGTTIRIKLSRNAEVG